MAKRKRPGDVLAILLGGGDTKWDDSITPHTGEDGRITI